jgi:uncharacterized Zn ribbon protein
MEELGILKDMKLKNWSKRIKTGFKLESARLY